MTLAVPCRHGRLAMPAFLPPGTAQHSPVIRSYTQEASLSLPRERRQGESLEEAGDFMMRLLDAARIGRRGGDRWRTGEFLLNTKGKWHGKPRGHCNTKAEIRPSSRRLAPARLPQRTKNTS